MASEARRLGYVRADEHIIMIHSPWMGKIWMPSGEEDPYTQVVRTGSSVGLSDLIIKEFALGIAVIVFLGSVVIVMSGRRPSPSEHEVVEAPVLPGG